MEQPTIKSTISFSKSSEYPNGLNDYTEVEFKEERLDIVLGYFEEFLKRCGYMFEGKLEFVSMKDKCINREEVHQCHCEEDSDVKADDMRKFITIFLDEMKSQENS